MLKEKLLFVLINTLLLCIPLLALTHRWTELQTEKQIHLLCVGWRNFFSSCGVVQAWVDHFVTSLSLHYPYLKDKKTISFHFWRAHLI
jgi:hypothetical protein